jgi:hypothetical protein
MKDNNFLSFPEEQPDGSMMVDVIENMPEDFRQDQEDMAEPISFNEMETDDFHANLVLLMSRDEALALGRDLIDRIEEDKQSRSEWLAATEKITEYLGFKVEEFQERPFKNASGVFDTTLSNALVEFLSNAKKELFPMKGPVTCEVIGVTNDQRDTNAQKLEIFLNTYLTKIDKAYIDESDRLLMYTGLYGCAFRKVYYDPLTNLPVARTIKPQDLICNNECTNLTDSTRITHLFSISKKELLLRIKSGFYAKVTLEEINEALEKQLEENNNKAIDKMEGIKKAIPEEKNRRDINIYESHVELSDFEFESSREDSIEDLPKPYIVSLLANGVILSIRRNFKRNDEYFKKNEYFVKFGYFPALGLYNYGLGQLIGSNAIILTQTLRNILNAETLRIFPRGVRVKGLEFSRTNLTIGPDEFLEIDTQGKPISEVLQFITAPEQSEVLLKLMDALKQQTATLASSGDVKIPEGTYNAPVGTTLALLEVQNKVTSVIISGLHRSLSDEFTMLYRLFIEGINDNYVFNLPGLVLNLSKQEMEDDINILPVSNPEVSSTAHSLIRSESLLKMAMSMPQIHNVRLAFLEMYRAMKVDNAEELLTPPPPSGPPPLDPAEVMKMDVEMKAQNNAMRHESDMLKDKIAYLKAQNEYLINQQKLYMEATKNGVPMPPPVPPMPPLNDLPYTLEEENRLQEQQMQKEQEAMAAQKEQASEGQNQTGGEENNTNISNPLINHGEQQ